MKKRTSAKRQLSLPISVAVGTGVIIFLILAAAALVGSLTLNGTIGESTIGALSKVFLFIAVFIGTTAAILMRDTQTLLVGAACAVTVILLQLLLCVFSYGGLSGLTLINSLIILAGAGCSIGIKLSRSKKSVQRKRHYR